MYPISYVSYILCILYNLVYSILAGCTRWGKQFGRNGRSVTLSSSKSPNTLLPSAGDFLFCHICYFLAVQDSSIGDLVSQSVIK